MSVILPSRLSWALSDRPARSKGMWFGIVGAFVAGIAVAGSGRKYTEGCRRKDPLRLKKLR